MRRKLGTIGAAAALLLCTTHIAVADSTFTDPTGDSSTAPDITTVTATNDSAGNLTFRVTTNQASLTADALLAISLDTDTNATTGQDGDDYVFLLDGTGWALLKWDGAKFAAASIPSANAGYASGTATFKVNKADIGVADSLVYYVDSLQFDATGDNVLASDTAPDGTGVFTYNLTKPASVKLAAGTPSFRPARAVAGHTETVTFSISRSDSGAGLASGTATCTVKIGTATVAAKGSLRAGVATCTFRIPQKAHAKMIHGSIHVSGAGASVTKAFSKRVA
jgi:hypothetical protein